MRRIGQEGQILLITLLILVVATTIALSVISRSTTDTTISRQVEESLRAFSAAEAGLERSLEAGAAQPAFNFPETKANVRVAAVTYGGTSTFEFGNTTYPRGGVATLWFVGHNADGSLNYSSFLNTGFNICWPVVGGTQPAVEVSVYYKNGNSFGVQRYAYDPANQNNFSVPTTGLCGSIANANIAWIPAAGAAPQSNRVMARIKVYYTPTTLLATAGVSFPAQGHGYTSCGSITGSNVTRCIQATKPFESPLDIFENAIYARATSIQ